MEITLKKAVQKFCGNKKELSMFKYYLKRSLQNTGYQKLVLREGEVIEIHDEAVTISFTWDMISAVNIITHKYVDLTIPERASDVFN